MENLKVIIYNDKDMIYREGFLSSIESNINISEERFLDTIAMPTRNTYRYILAKAYKYEKMFNKDIYEFSFILY